jgi:sigma-B regulation protein RsbU (phosphoserine phosphatase)
VTALSITSLFYLTLGIILLLLGFIILKENRSQRLNRITGVMMFFAGMGPIFGAFGILLETSPLTSIVLKPLGQIFLIWEFFFPQMLLFAMVFPKEVKWAKNHPRLLYWIFLPHIVHFLLVLSFSNPEQIESLINLQALSDRFGLIVQPVTILLGLFLSLMSLIYQFHANFFALINLIYILMAIALMVWGYRKLKTPRLKKQVGLVLWGIRASVGLYAIAFIFPKLNLLHTTPTVIHLLTSIALLIGAGSIAWAIIKYQFLDIQLIIRRGLIFSLASGVLIGLYLIVYGEGKKLITNLFGIRIPILEILFIILALLFFQPILSSIEKLIEKLFMRDRMDYRNVLKDLSRDIMTTLDISMLRQKMISTLKQTMSLETAELFLSDKSGNYVSQGSKEGIYFNSNDSCTQILKQEKNPIGFDELSLRITNEHDLEKLRTLGAYLLIPFVYREELIGILILGEKITKTSFNTEDMTILSVLSDQASIAIENARLHQEMIEKQRIEEELGFAKEIQTHLLPHQAFSHDCFDLAGYNLPSKEVGGDYFDFIPLSEDKTGIAIGDISGKGIPAAILMSNLQAALRISAAKSTAPRDVMQQVNIHITQTTSAEKFATFFYGIFDSINRTLEYTNAGHNFPVLWRQDGTSTFLQEGGLIIGVMEGALYKTEHISFKPDDFLVLYTDGITEALNPYDEEFGESRLVQTIEKSKNLSANGIIDNILEAVVDFSHGHMQTDDLTLVVLKVK